MNEMPKNTPTLQGPLQQLTALGQSLWLDSIDRHLIASGELARLVNEGSVRGLTSNPAIFQKAMAGQDYRDDIGRLRRAGRSALEVYETLAIADLQAAADIFRPLYEQSGAADGYVSFEVAPSLAHDAAGTVAEAQRLWRALERPNAMIKVPGTPAGIEALEQLITEGINVNVTLLFSTAVYAAVAKAYMRAIARRHALGLALRPVASVASFFVSRVDSKVDAELDRLVGKPDLAAQIAAVRGQAAIANAKVAWAVAGECYATAQWQALAAAGAAMGQHRKQESGGARRALHRGTDRTGHGQHRAPGNPGSLCRSRPRGTYLERGAGGSAPHSAASGRAGSRH